MCHFLTNCLKFVLSDTQGLLSFFGVKRTLEKPASTGANAFLLFYILELYIRVLLCETSEKHPLLEPIVSFTKSYIWFWNTIFSNIWFAFYYQRKYQTKYFIVVAEGNRHCLKCHFKKEIWIFVIKKGKRKNI